MPPSVPAAPMQPLFNTSGLESLLQQFQCRLDSQQQTIESLQAQLSSETLSSKAFVQWRTSVDDRLTKQEKRLDSLEHLTRSLPQTTRDVSDHRTHLQQISHRLNGTLTKHEYDLLHAKSESDLKQTIDELTSNKADKSAFAALEQAQHSVVLQCRSVQQVLACKVDESQLPVLLDEQNRMRHVLDKHKEVDRRMDSIETQVKHALKELDFTSDSAGEQTHFNNPFAAKPVVTEASKDDNATPRPALTPLPTVQFSHPRTLRSMIKDIESALTNRPTLTWLESNVIAPVARFDKHMRAVSGKHAKLDAMLTEHATMRSTVAQFQREMSSIETTAKHINQLHSELNERLSRCITQPQLLLTLKQHAKAIQQQTTEGHSQAIQQVRLVGDNLQQLREDITLLQSQHSTLAEHAQIAERFISWFTEVKLKGV